MAYSAHNAVKPRRYIQYNDLVFTGTKSVLEQAESVAFRVNGTSRSFSHGSYVGLYDDEVLVDTNTISFKIALKTNTWSENNVRVHYDFIINQLTRAGKLWAVEAGNQLVWCNALITSLQPQKEWVITDDGYLVFQVEFNNTEGVWYKANENYTFFDPWELCDFTQVKADCLRARCCDDTESCTSNCDCCENVCGELKDALDYCTAMSDPDFVEEFYLECDSKWRVVHNCQKARLDGAEAPALYEHSLCDICVSGAMSKSFQSDTVLNSRKWKVALFGAFTDPILTINNNSFQVFGDYKGVLFLDYKSNVRYAKSWECADYDYEDIPLDSVDFCGNIRIHQGHNTVSIYGVTSSTACAYLDYERVTL